MTYMNFNVRELRVHLKGNKHITKEEEEELRFSNSSIGMRERRMTFIDIWDDSLS